MKKRTIRIPVRVNVLELEKIDRKKGSMPRAAYLRSSALGASLVTIPEINREAFASLGHALSSVNQVARLANSGRIVTYPPTDFNQLERLLIEVRDALIGGKNGS